MHFLKLLSIKYAYGIATPKVTILNCVFECKKKKHGGSKKISAMYKYVWVYNWTCSVYYVCLVCLNDKFKYHDEVINLI